MLLTPHLKQLTWLINFGNDALYHERHTTGFVLLEDEINYINNFIELQKMRLDSSVKLEYHSLQNIPALQIAPMLLIPFIENAFKHGVNAEQQSHIKIELSMNEKQIQLLVVNNKVSVQKGHF